MIGVKFNTAIRPWGAGDTALLPERIAQAVVDSGEAELYEFPAEPHAHESGFAVPVTKPMKPGKDYIAKKGRG